MKILGDRALIIPLPVQERTPTGIFLPQGQAGDVMHYWRVEQVSAKWSKPEVAVGDTVITPLHISHHTLDDGRKIVDADQFIGMLETPPTPGV
jgi:co-chaperonin GroES (HSP10)